MLGGCYFQLTLNLSYFLLCSSHPHTVLSYIRMGGVLPRGYYYMQQFKMLTTTQTSWELAKMGTIYVVGWKKLDIKFCNDDWASVKNAYIHTYMHMKQELEKHTKILSLGPLIQWMIPPSIFQIFFSVITLHLQLQINSESLSLDKVKKDWELELARIPGTMLISSYLIQHLYGDRNYYYPTFQTRKLRQRS